MTRLLHIAAEQRVPAIWTDVFLLALAEIGGLEIVDEGSAIPEPRRAEMIRECDILLTGWGSSPVPVELASNPGRLRYVCHITGGMRGCIPIELIDAGIPVTNWGEAPANGVAEGAMTLLLATLKDLHHQVQTVRDNGWAMDMRYHGGSLEGLSVGVYGCGVIGRRFIELLQPFGSTIHVFDPHAPEIPVGCVRVDSLEELFTRCEVIVVHAGLTEQTRGTVTAELLARLPRHGVIVNTARGGIIDQEALFAELESGRLRAGLDVLEPDSLPPGHPARRWENLILSAHRIEYGWPSDGDPPKKLTRMQEICVDNLRRFLAGQPLRYPMDHNRFELST